MISTTFWTESEAAPHDVAHISSRGTTGLGNGGGELGGCGRHRSMRSPDMRRSISSSHAIQAVAQILVTARRQRRDRRDGRKGGPCPRVVLSRPGPWNARMLRAPRAQFAPREPLEFLGRLLAGVGSGWTGSRGSSGGDPASDLSLSDPCSAAIHQRVLATRKPTNVYRFADGKLNR